MGVIPDWGPAGGARPAGPVDHARLDERERRLDAVVSRGIGYLGLVIGVALSPFIMETTPAFWSVTAVLVTASALWTYAFVTRQPPPAAVPRWGAVFLAGYLVLMALLVHLSPIYGFHALGGYLFSLTYLHGWWRWLGVAGTSVLASYGQLGGSAVVPLTDITGGVAISWAALAVLNGLVAGGFTYFGQLNITQSQRRRAVIDDLNEANRRLSETLEENAALQARLLASAREAGVLDERARLAREIHDTIAQGLTGVVAQLEAAAAVDHDPELRRRHSDTAVALARENLSEARRSVEALTPGQLDRARLPDAIADMAKRWGETAGVELVLDTTGDPVPLLTELEVVLFRVAQEALVNVGKHAGARRVGLTLSYMDDLVVLDVRDDGRGFAPAEVVTTEESGYGLAAMEQRVRRVSGAFTVESAPGEGTALSASVPAIPAEVRA